MDIKIFSPLKITKHPLDISYLNALSNKKWQYAVNGRNAIYHILKPLNINNILVPVYICETILIPLKELGITPVFYDLDIDDLNPSLESIKYLSGKYDIKTVLVASMYGNPASLKEIEAHCKSNNMFLIDDAAQSFGAVLENQYVGTYGNAGFFSFSPGKPTAGHLGAFYWSDNFVPFDRTQHCFFHYMKWLDFYFNRLHIYKSYLKPIGNLLQIVTKTLLKFISIKFDDICKFEKNILGGIIHDNLSSIPKFRQYYTQKFLDEFNDNSHFKIIKQKRGENNPHKIVLIFHTIEMAKSFIAYMKKHHIYSNNGYALLSDNLNDLPNAGKIKDRVVELPIEDHPARMKYLFTKVNEYDF